ncbi:HWE histidine kinase domain-containing protein [Caulobacter segnis]|nr:HWE histidine kinase domain-containing protein [Caulobacter segnis]MDG2523481.1 HWE histidine kinase domain-containing protein [Caulobacter segnis]
MAVSLIAPALVFMGLLVQTEYDNSRRRFEEQLVAMTRALAVATDRQIAQGTATLQALAVSPALAEGDFPAFARQARAATAQRDGWIVLMDEQRQVVNTHAPPGTPLPMVGIPERGLPALQSGRTLVSNLYIGPVADRPIIVIALPVRVKGKLYALGYVQEPRAFQSIFNAQKLPASWTGTIVDREAAVVARSKEADKYLGRHASRDMRTAMKKAEQGVIQSKTLDGTPTLSSFARSPAYGWAFIVGVPRAELEGTIFKSLALLSAAFLTLLALGVTAAIMVSRRISREVVSLMGDAAAIGRGGVVQERPRDLFETAEVRGALREVSQALAERENERQAADNRQQLMINELNHRVKNTLATVQSLAWQSLGRKHDRALFDAFADRLAALSRAHDLLTRRVWENAELEDVITQTLEPYGSRARGEGPEVHLAPNAAVTLSMVLHELATNAAKYGALSSHDGVVEVRWSVEGGRLKILWRERGGPVVQKPAGTGFGSRLIESSILREFGGETFAEYSPKGLERVMILPLSDRVSLG